MLELKDITFTIPKDGEDFDLLHQVSIKLTPGHFMAIVGPSGCGKTTLLKVIAGLNEESDGQVFWNDQDLSEEDLEPSEIGYVPQFSIAYDHLTVEESIESSVKLRVKTASRSEMEEVADVVIAQTGLDNIRDNKVRVLSGGQKRRLGLAMELVSNPVLLLCDEVTSGLDPKSEREIVRLMHYLAKQNERTVISVTHSLSNLELYDSVLVMYDGMAVYHGPPNAMTHYFSADSAEDVYPRLSKRSALRWHRSWAKHRDSYYGLFAKEAKRKKEDEEAKAAAEKESPVSANRIIPVDEDEEDEDDLNPKNDDIEEEDLPKKKKKDSSKKSDKEELDASDSEDDKIPVAASETPGSMTQFGVLLARRWKIFLRDRTQLFLHLAIMIGFPFLVIIFAPKGVEPPMEQLAFDAIKTQADLELQADRVQQHIKVGGTISGLVMFQVILLTLMGSNNSAREIVGERLIMEKEKLGGLRPGSYLMSKLAFLLVLVVIQAVWMSVFVQFFTNLPGNFLTRTLLLLLVTGAMTSVCLAISALMRSSEQASLLSIYLVGFQLPLSGAVLALPGVLSKITQPFIAAYWSWSGQLQAMKDDKSYLGIKNALPQGADDAVTSLAPSSICFFILGVHIIVGIVFAYIGCRKSQWDMQ